MKMLHLMACESAIPKLINIDLPVLYAYRVSMLVKPIQEAMGNLQQFRAQFITKHGVKEDNRYAIPKDKAIEFDAGIDQIAQEEIDIKPPEIPLSIILESDIKITAMEINALKNAGFVVDDISTIEE